MRKYKYIFVLSILCSLYSFFVCLCFSDETPQPNRKVSGETLSFHTVTVDNTAVYQCNASNPYGYLLANAFVSVLRK